MRLLIAQVNRPGASSSFLVAHAERLFSDVTVTWGSLGMVLGGPRAVPALSAFGRTLAAFARRERAIGGWERRTSELSFEALLARVRPDVVLAEFGPTGVRVMRACGRAQVPFVVHFHGFDASERAILTKLGAAYRELFARADAVVGVSQEMMQRLRELGAPDDKLRYNPCGVDIERFFGAAPRSASPTFLSVGRLVEKKAPHLTLRAFASVHAVAPSARLRMIGDGPLLARCTALAKELGVEDAVSFLGARSHEEVQEEMRMARAFVQHSVEAPSGDREGTPVAVLEASATGLPVVATRHAGITDVVIEGVTGLLVDEGDVEGMAAHMRALVESPELASSLGVAGRARVEKHFSMDRSIATLRSILEEAVVSRAGASGASRRGRD